MEELWFTCESNRGNTVQRNVFCTNDLDGIKKGAQQLLKEGVTPISIRFGRFNDCALFVEGSNKVEQIIEGVAR
ncbi:hypothetical protein [Tetragenococcus halophilus]|uniref:hypothetical protein n=1 Tax=Tetragenococcus halophilus TaxID=51669 RepID=UPI002A923608|nr:hypothetical protein TEHSL10_11850 [Tetragenococcus halophilus]